MPAAKNKQSSKIEAQLKEIYFNASQPASFGGIKRLQTAVPKASRASVERFLNQQWAYNLHKPTQYKFQRRKYVTRGVNEQWQADLVEMQHYSRENQGSRYILCVIDIFSRYAYAQPLKTKSGPDVAYALETILQDARPKYLQTDEGKEFYNQHVQSLLSRLNVQLFSVHSEKKAAIVERFQRTLQEKMYRAFTYQGNYKWLELLPKLIEAYNNSYHRSIKTSPAKVNTKNETDVWLTQYSALKKGTKAPKYKVGDTVRIPKQKKIFSKGYIEKWTDEEFTISKVNTKYTPYLYNLTDIDGEIIRGSFYEQELQLVTNKQKLYRIERIIRTRMLNNKKIALVKWFGYKEPTWLDYASIQSIIK